jgi:hypothetical protein
LEPKSASSERIWAKVQGNSEQSVPHGQFYGKGEAALVAIGRRIVEAELEVVQAIGRIAVVVEPALVTDRGAHGSGGKAEGGRQEAEGQQPEADLVFHVMYPFSSEERLPFLDPASIHCA